MPVYVTVPVNGFSGVWIYVCVCVCLWGSKWWNPSLPPPPPPSPVSVSVCAACQTLVMEARQFDDFWSFSGCVVAGSGMARKLNGSPILLVPMWPGLSAGFCRLLLSTMLDVLDARLSRVLHRRQQERVFSFFKNNKKNIKEAVVVCLIRCKEKQYPSNKRKKIAEYFADWRKTQIKCSYWEYYDEKKLSFTGKYKKQSKTYLWASVKVTPIFHYLFLILYIIISHL